MSSIWIDVNESLPEPGDEVLVAIDFHRGPQWSNTIMLVAFFSEYDRKFHEEQHPEHDSAALEFVTRWMPLPEPPKWT